MTRRSSRALRASATSAAIARPNWGEAAAEAEEHALARLTQGLGIGAREQGLAVLAMAPGDDQFTTDHVVTGFRIVGVALHRVLVGAEGGSTVDQAVDIAETGLGSEIETRRHQRILRTGVIASEAKPTKQTSGPEERAGLRSLRSQ